MNFAVQLAASKFRAADDKNVPNDRRALWMLCQKLNRKSKWIFNCFAAELHANFVASAVIKTRWIETWWILKLS